MSKKISQLQTSSGTDDTTFIPIIMGEPKVNRKISSKNLISPTDDPINEIISDLSDLAYTADLDIKSDVIGYLEYNSPAPTPNENGKFEFTVGGFCSWLDSVVFVNDQVLVTKLETHPVTYEYVHMPVVSNYATPLDVEEAVSSLNVKYDGAFVENAARISIISAMESAKNTSSKSPPMKNTAPVNTVKIRKLMIKRI